MKITRVAGAALLGMSVLLMGASGCQSKLHKAEATAAGIAASLHAVETANHNSTLETVQEKAKVAELVKDAVLANDEFIASLGQAENNGGKVDTASLFAAFDTMTASIAKLQAEGVLHIKSPDAQLAFKSYLDALKIAIATLKGLYPAGSVASLTHLDYALPAMAIALSPAQIEEIIAALLAAGSELATFFIGLRGKSGVELLTEASDTDKSTLEMADEDIAAAKKEEEPVVEPPAETTPPTV